MFYTKSVTKLGDLTVRPRLFPFGKLSKLKSAAQKVYLIWNQGKFDKFVISCKTYGILQNNMELKLIHTLPGSVGFLPITAHIRKDQKRRKAKPKTTCISGPTAKAKRRITPASWSSK